MLNRYLSIRLLTAGVGVAGWVILISPLLGQQSSATNSVMSPTEKLVVELATIDLSSEKHKRPEKAVAAFREELDEFLLKKSDPSDWKITTVRKADHFELELIHAERDGIAVRLLPEIIMFSFTPSSPNWRDRPTETVLDFLQANITGNWHRIQTDDPQTVEGRIFLKSAGGGFTTTFGSRNDSFVAVIVEDQLCICLTQRNHAPRSSSLPQEREPNPLLPPAEAEDLNLASPPAQKPKPDFNFQSPTTTVEAGGTGTVLLGGIKRLSPSRVERKLWRYDIDSNQHGFSRYMDQN